MGPTAVGVIVNVCGAAEAVNVRVTGVDSPPPTGVTLMTTVTAWLGVMVKSAEAVLRRPPMGPVNV